MKIEFKHTEFGKYYFVLDEKGEPIGSIISADTKMMQWLEDKGIWSNGGEMEVDVRYPNLSTGSIVYAIDDPKKEPYRWRTWDQAERCSEMYDFIDPTDKDYTFKLKLPWDK